MPGWPSGDRLCKHTGQQWATFPVHLQSRWGGAHSAASGQQAATTALHTPCRSLPCTACMWHMLAIEWVTGGTSLAWLCSLHLHAFVCRRPIVDQLWPHSSRRQPLRVCSTATSQCPRGQHQRRPADPSADCPGGRHCPLRPQFVSPQASPLTVLRYRWLRFRQTLAQFELVSISLDCCGPTL